MVTEQAGKGDVCKRSMTTWSVRYKRPLQPRGSAFRFGAGFLDDFLRFPIDVESVIRETTTGQWVSLGRTHDHVTLSF